MGLTLLAGPANAGKVALLLKRYLAAIDREPCLIVPNRPDVDRVERDLLALSPALLGGSIGTFDDLFERVARAGGGWRPPISDAQRALLVRRVVARGSLNGLGRSARFGGFADALGTTIAELESGLADPADLDGDLAALYGSYRAELDRLGLFDRDLVRRYAAERVGGDLEAWDGRPVFAYGFEDLTGAQWTLLEALAGRADVTVSLPYEPGRPAFASLERTASDLAALAAGHVEELPPAYADVAHPALAHLERGLFADPRSEPAPPLEGAIRFLEGAGSRGSVELVAEEVLELLRGGTAAESIAIVCPALERMRAVVEGTLGVFGIPFAVEGRIRLSQTAFGQALLSLLRFLWLGGGRRELYGFLRSPYSGLARSHVDYLEGRLRGRAVLSAQLVEEETLRLRGQPIPLLETVRAAPSAVEAVRTVARAMLRGAYGLEAPPVGESARLDLRAHEQVVELLQGLEGWEALAGAVSPEEIVGTLERGSVRLSSAGEAGRVAVVDLQRARTRRYDIVFLLGLEEGSLPRRTTTSPFLDDDARRELDEKHRSARLLRADSIERDRYLVYTACTRPTRRLYLVREAATDDGSPREPSPFWDEARGLFPADDVDRWTRRRRLAALTWPLEQAPSERERLRSVAALAASQRDTALALARANSWDRRLERACGAFDRPTRLAHPNVLDELRARNTFGVTELESFATCSSMWFVERLLSPKTIDAEVDPMLRGSVAHQALFKFFSGLPKQVGSERVVPERVEEAVAFMRKCLDEALAGGVRLELTPLQRAELAQSLWRDLEHVVRQEAESTLPLVPRRFEVSFGSERSAPELQRGLELDGFALSGKIDRIDVDPFSTRGIVQDYKSGKTAHSATQIESELKLQIPLYMLVLRDLVGIEPLGGVYRALGGERRSRGLLREEAKADGVPGFAKNDYKPEDEFWAQVERAKEHASRFVARIRDGDVQHDPLGGFPCPSWCDLWPMCRVKRA